MCHWFILTKHRQSSRCRYSFSFEWGYVEYKKVFSVVLDSLSNLIWQKRFLCLATHIVMFKVSYPYFFRSSKLISRITFLGSIHHTLNQHIEATKSKPTDLKSHYSPTLNLKNYCCENHFPQNPTPLLFAISTNWSICIHWQAPSRELIITDTEITKPHKHSKLCDRVVHVTRICKGICTI